MSDSDQPVQLQQVEGTRDRFLIYIDGRGVQVELRYEGDALWMSQAQMAALFGRDTSVISRHISNILEEGELSQETSLQKLQTSQMGRPGTIYSLDMVISVGYRVSSAQATLFRKWATGVLVRFATKGFVVNVQRLKNPQDYDRVAELREIIRDIRASEANMYAEVRRICSMCQDYDPQSEEARRFYQHTQAKLFYAVTNRTPSDIIGSRSNADLENMGLQTWARVEITKSDALIAKNYLSESEVKELNRLTDILLSIFEDQLELGKLTTMAQAEDLLERQLIQLQRLVLRHGGQISSEAAKDRATAEYRRFDEKRKTVRAAEVARELTELRNTEGTLPKRPKKS